MEFVAISNSLKEDGKKETLLVEYSYIESFKLSGLRFLPNHWVGVSMKSGF